MTAGAGAARSNLKRAFGFGGSMAGVRLACSFLSIKITAIYLGPAGLALVAQFANFVTLWQSMISTGLGTGVVRLSAEYGEDPARRQRLLSTALRMGIVMVVALTVVLMIGAPFFSHWLFSDNSYAWLIAISGFAVGAMVINDVLSSSMTAVREIGVVAGANVVATVVGLCVFLFCCYTWGVTGGLIGSFTVYLVTFAIMFFGLKMRSQLVKLSDFGHGFDRKEGRRLLSFYPMLIMNGMVPPLALIVVRDALVGQFGLDTAGIWQATWRLSEAYQMVITSSISLYFMTRMGEVVDDPLKLRHEVWRSVGTAIAVTGVLATGIFVLREWIVHIVFSKAFAPVADLLPLQLIGDVLKMAAWILSMVLVALVRTRWFIALIVIVGLVFAGSAKLLIPYMGEQGAVLAYLISSATHVVLGAIALRDVLFMPGSAKALQPAVEEN